MSERIPLTEMAAHCIEGSKSAVMWFEGLSGEMTFSTGLDFWMCLTGETYHIAALRGVRAWEPDYEDEFTRFMHDVRMKQRRKRR